MEKSAKRELTFKILYSGQINKEMNDEELQIFLGENNLKERDKEDRSICRNSKRGSKGRSQRTCRADWKMGI